MAGKTDYGRMSDEELVNLYHGGDNSAADFLVEKYKNLVRMKARTYFLIGADNDDLIQEGMIGLYKAIRDYNSERQAVFMTFASVCVSRQIRTAVTACNRKKNAPLNTYISLDSPVTDEMGEDAKLEDVIASDQELNPESLVIDREQTSVFLTKLYESLSKLERQVLELYQEGLSYVQIADSLGKPAKAVDNAIQRIRSKINQIRK